ncbi:hypothetical protein [Salinivibrio costicola]|uniref:hypothetical protein n=1 Tax=Salinivibrio costicola TaxID=51367 RepID=UPI003F7046CC
MMLADAAVVSTWQTMVATGCLIDEHFVQKTIGKQASVFYHKFLCVEYGRHFLPRAIHVRRANQKRGQSALVSNKN